MFYLSPSKKLLGFVPYITNKAYAYMWKSYNNTWLNAELFWIIVLLGFGDILLEQTEMISNVKYLCLIYGVWW